MRVSYLFQYTVLGSTQFHGSHVNEVSGEYPTQAELTTLEYHIEDQRSKHNYVSGEVMILNFSRMG